METDFAGRIIAENISIFFFLEHQSDNLLNVLQCLIEGSSLGVAPREGGAFHGVVAALVLLDDERERTCASTAT